MSQNSARGTEKVRKYIDPMVFIFRRGPRDRGGQHTGVSPGAKTMGVNKINGEEKHRFDPQRSPSYTYNNARARPQTINI